MGRVCTLLLSAFALLETFSSSALVRVGASPLLGRAEPPVVDLDYSVYEGTYDEITKLNVFKGIRYAAAPIGKLRWQAPNEPPIDRNATVPAKNDPPRCPQTGASSETPPEYGFVSGLGNEDCLFLNVYAPAGASKLPVFFWIHGGGYALGSIKSLNPSALMTDNNNQFISVIIQYRLGAFGFLAGQDVKESGALNAGLLDMNFALQWIQKHIEKFGGDPARVTIGGESAGAAAVTYQALAYGGKQEQVLFNNVIAASPWIPNQYNYNDSVPIKAYDDFVSAAGCGNSENSFQCIVSADSSVLQNASAKVSEAGPFGTFAFLPVTDGIFIQGLPSKQLAAKALQGKRILSGNNANEGVPLSPPTAKTLAAFRNYTRVTLPHFVDADFSALEFTYSYENDDKDTDPSSLLYETDGTSPSPNAISQSAFGTGQQQRVFNIFAEYCFVCPSYFLSYAFPQAWKYQYSAPNAYHGADLSAYWSDGAKTPGAGFRFAFHKIWGNFIVNDTPIILIKDAKGGMDNATVPAGSGDLINWPEWTAQQPSMLSLNTTGGQEQWHNVTANLRFRQWADPGVTNEFKLVDAYEWEGGRGARCQWWMDMATKVPY